jgi:hypothetical protein
MVVCVFGIGLAFDFNDHHRIAVFEEGVHLRDNIVFLAC